MEQEKTTVYYPCGKEMYVCLACGKIRCESTTPSHWLRVGSDLGDVCSCCCPTVDPKTCKCDNCLGRKGGE